MDAAGLTNRLTVHELVSAVARAEADVSAALAAVARAEETVNRAFGIDPTDAMRIRVASAASRMPSTEDVRTELRRQAWSLLVERLEVRGMMSTRRWEELRRRLALDSTREEPPPVTHEQVGAFLREVSTQMEDMLREKVDEVFEWLRPRGEAGRLKTNSQYEVPRKVILPYVVERRTRYWLGWMVNHRAEQELIALESVFAALDGAGAIVKTAYSAISSVIKAPGFDGAGEVPYFAFRVFGNGRMHLTFTRPDLLARFNALAGGKRLRAP